MFGRTGAYLVSAPGRARLCWVLRCIGMLENAQAKAVLFVGVVPSLRKRSGRLFLRKFVLILVFRVAIAELLLRSVCF